jgi:hypothetical protein
VILSRQNILVQTTEKDFVIDNHYAWFGHCRFLGNWSNKLPNSLK